MFVWELKQTACMQFELAELCDYEVDMKLHWILNLLQLIMELYSDSEAIATLQGLSQQDGSAGDYPILMDRSDDQLEEGGEEDEGGRDAGSNSQSARALVSREDLERHFGYSLAEAAARLGVCKTTIKRACRSVLPVPCPLLYRHAPLYLTLLHCKNTTRLVHVPRSSWCKLSSRLNTSEQIITVNLVLLLPSRE